MKKMIVSALFAAALAAQGEILCEGFYKWHLQGVATDGELLYWSFSDRVVKTDAGGKVIVSSGADKLHYGDLCVAGGVISCYWLAMTLGCAAGGAIGARVSARTMMAVCSAAGIALLTAVIVMPLEYTTVFGATLPKSMILMALCGLCTSVMWSSIFNLAVEGLGTHLALASGIFMTMVSGGMLLPLQGLLADRVGILNSYGLTMALFAYLFVYAVVLSRPVRPTPAAQAF